MIAGFQFVYVISYISESVLASGVCSCRCGSACREPRLSCDICGQRPEASRLSSPYGSGSQERMIQKVLR